MKNFPLVKSSLELNPKLKEQRGTLEIYTYNLIIFTCLCLHLYTDTYHKGRINTTYKVEPEINRNI